jgi:hypothetical protein
MPGQLWQILPILVLVAGVAQLVLIVASLAIPRVLRWGEDTARLRPLTRQIFWTYAGYIWATNLCFGLLSALAPQWLLDRSPLAGAVSGYIAAYWAARLLLQFVYLDRRDVPPGVWPRLAEVALVALFLYLAVVYGCVVAGTVLGVSA